MPESTPNNAVAVQAIHPNSPYLTRRNRWALLLNLACVNQVCYELDCKDGPLPPMLSDLPAHRLDEREFMVYLIRHGVAPRDLSTFADQLCFFTTETIAPNDRIVPLIVHTDPVLPYHRMDCFSKTHACSLSCPYLTTTDECVLLIHLLRLSNGVSGDLYDFFEPPFPGLPSQLAEPDLEEALLYNHLAPDRVVGFLSDFNTLNSMRIHDNSYHDAILIAPPLAYEPRS